MKLFKRYVKTIHTSWLLLWYCADDEIEIPSVLVKTEVYFGLGGHCQLFRDHSWLCSIALKLA